MNFFNLTLQELENILIENNLKKYCSKQLFSWIYKKLVFDFSQMTDISQVNRDFLFKTISIKLPEIVKIQKSKLDGTKKAVLKLSDNKTIETVLIPQQKHNTICLSTQVGCPAKCTFCLSGKDGLVRNLEVSEIISQFVFFSNQIKPVPINNIVFMGTGEPLLNLQNLKKAILILIDKNGISLPKNNITVSTVGIPEKIIEFADMNLSVNLSFSLHSADDTKRKEIIPFARKYDLKSIIKSLKYYQDKTRRAITIEYTLFKNFNTSDDDINLITKLLKDLRVKINLIPYNKNDTSPLLPLSDNETLVFKEKLIEKRFLTLIRKSRGRDILAACGELKANS